MSILFRIAKVASVDDSQTDGMRIKVRMMNSELKTNIEDLPYAFPLIPKLIGVLPKKNENVLIFTMDSENPYSDRFYIGPIISQPQFMDNGGELPSTSLLGDGFISSTTAPSTNADTIGLYPEKEDIYIQGRGDTSVICKPNEVQISVAKGSKTNKKEFNKKNPTYIQLKEGQGKDKDNAINVVADRINLISYKSKTQVRTTDNKKLITDKDFDDIRKKLYSIPYGEILIELLDLIIKNQINHVHPYNGMPQVNDINAQQLLEFDTSTILSESVKTN